LGLSKSECLSKENAIILNAIKVFQAKLLAIIPAVMLVLSESFPVVD
jgi:hypothetical protein